MEQSLCKLTIAYPPATEDLLVSVMLASEPPLSGFSTVDANGHGVDFHDATMNEKVRGRVRRGLMLIILPRARVPSLLEEIKEKAAIPRLAYWIEPVEAFGRLT
jgi:hypothetical protein